MKKTKKIRRLLSSFICLIGSSLGLTMGLSSCELSSNDDKNDNGPDDSVITPPDNDNNDQNNGDDNNDNEQQPSQPETKPEVKPPADNKPINPNPPENKPEPIPPGSNLINSESISLKYYGQLLPSQYLKNINKLDDLNIDNVYIKENFDNTNISDTKYTVLSLDDWIGVLSIKMEYKNKIDNKLHEFIFNFSNLAKLEDQNYNLYFDVKDKSLLNAKEISSKSINNDVEAKSFFTYLKEKGTNLIFKNGTNNLPLYYLDFSGGLTFNGFKDNWYTSNNDLELNIKPKLLKINIYEKTINNNIYIKQKVYPVNLSGGVRNPIKLSCASALDYLLEQIIVNETYKEDKFASYYYYDIIYNKNLNAQLQISNNKWLKNIKHTIDGYDLKQYKPIISRYVNPSIDNEGNLTIQIEMQLGDENIFSKKSKELIIKSFLPMNQDFFYYNGESKVDKFNLTCSVENKDIIFNSIKNKKNLSSIKSEIKSSSQQVVNLNKYFEVQDYKNFQKYIELYFGYEKVIKGEISRYYISTNKRIAIEDYYIYSNDIVQYDKINQCFQIKCTLTIQTKGIDNDSSTSEAMIVNITKINTPIE